MEFIELTSPEGPILLRKHAILAVADVDEDIVSCRIWLGESDDVAFNIIEDYEHVVALVLGKQTD